MAVAAELGHFDGLVEVHLYPNTPVNSIVSAPDNRDWPFFFYYDEDKLVEGQLEFLGIKALDVSFITDNWLDELDKLDLPRVDIPGAGLADASIADVLRWARETFPSRYSRAMA